jgi:HEAT repeat protein
VLPAVLALSACRKQEPAPVPPPPPVSSNATDATPTAKPTISDQQRKAMLDAIGKLGAGDTKHSRIRPTQLTPEQKARLDKLKLEIGSELTADEKIALLDGADDIQALELVEVVKQALDDKSSEVRLRAIEMLTDWESSDILGAVSKAMGDSEEEVREAAINTLYNVLDPKIGEVLTKGLSDESELVRSAALDMLAEQPADLRANLQQQALLSTNEDVIMGLVSQLEDQSDHKALELLIEGLRHPNEELRQNYTDAIDFLVSQNFTSYEEAKAWWAKNKQNYDDELFEK